MSLTDAPSPPAAPRNPRPSVPPAPPASNAPAEHPEHPEQHDELPKNLRQPHFLLVAAVALLFAALLAGLFVLGYQPHMQALAAAKQEADAASHDNGVVAVTHPRPALGAKDVVLPCDIRPYQDTSIFPRASGYLKALHADIHDHVKKDQLLAEIDAPEVDAQLEQAKAALVQAQANQTKAQTDLALAQRSLERFQSANASGGEVSRQELDERIAARDQANAALAQTAANIDGARANIQRLQVLQGFDKITAPFDGVITVRNYDVGALLSPTGGREIFHIQQSDTLRVFVNVPQVYATQVHMGQPATLTVRNYNQRTFTGTVARSADAINPGTRTMPFELHFANEDGALVPGMYGQVRLQLDTPPQALLIPVSAMLFNATGTQVMLVTGGKIHFQNVTLGRDLGTDLEVLGGLSPDATLVINPSERLTEGLAVDTAESAANKPDVPASKPASK